MFEYGDSAAADGAVSGLDKLEIADHKLSVQRVPAHAASLLLQPTSAPAAPPRPPPPAAREVDPLTLLPPTPVIRLSNMTTPAELANDEEYMELQEDVSEECNVYGSVCSVVIPRGGGESDGEEVGMVYVHFTHSEGAAKAKQAIAGRMFNGNIVKATFYPEVLFTQQVSSYEVIIQIMKCPVEHSQAGSLNLRNSPYPLIPTIDIPCVAIMFCRSTSFLQTMF